jgi:hypothetical protein
VVEGFSKNMFASLGSNIPFFLFAWLGQALGFLEPLIVLALAAAGVYLPAYSVSLSLLSVIVSLLLWGTYYWRFGFPLYLTVLYPFSVLFATAIAMRSMITSLSGNASWKGRQLERQKARLW